MNTKTPYQFAILRYIHDPLTEEFLNVGVVLYAKHDCYLKVKISSRYTRLSNAFVSNINGAYYRRLVTHISSQILQLQKELKSSAERLVTPHQWPTQIEFLLTQVLPKDDSSLVFGGYGGGLTINLDNELAYLYARLVEKYQDKKEFERRNDNDVWDMVYKPHFIERQILPHLEPVILKTPTYQQEFRYAWQNARYHPLETVSFDMVHAHSIRRKTARWIGNAQLLSDSEELGTLYLLVGKPSHSDLLHEYHNAVLNLRQQLPNEHRVVEEDEAVEFSKDFAHLIATHAR